MSLEPSKSTETESAQETTLRFVHTADLHLDSPLRTLAMHNHELAELVENATHTALIRTVDFCLSQSVHALLIAGDLYDGDQKSMHTAALLSAQMRRLDAANIPVFIIRGNHDSRSTITKRLSLPKNVHVFDALGGRIDLTDDVGNSLATIHGVSFAKPHAPESLLPKFLLPIKDTINIGMLHTSLSGSAQHDVYAPCSVSELDAFGYDYWALGHIHKRSEQGVKSTIVMPGIPQGRDVGETGVGTISLVSINEQRDVTVQEQPVSPVQFEIVNADVTACKDWHQLLDQLITSIKHIRQTAQSDYVIARVVMSGNTHLHFNLVRDTDLLQSTLQAECESIGSVWIEKLRIKTNKPDNQNDAASTHEALPDLAAIINESVLSSEQVKSNAEEELRLFTSKLPIEVRNLFGETEQERADMLDTLLSEGSAELLGQLSIGDDS